MKIQNPRNTMNPRNPIIVITGSCANSGKSYLAKNLSIDLGSNTTILSSDKIRIPLHSGIKSNHKLWNTLTKEKQKDLGNVFDKLGGYIINQKTNKPYTKKQIDKYGGIWSLSSFLTAKYIIDYITKHRNETIIIEGQFQLTKNANIDLITKLSKLGAYFFYMNTDLEICKERHNRNNKNYNKDNIGKYLEGNKPLEKWLEDKEWISKLTKIQKTILDSTKQYILDGNIDVKDNIENVKKIIYKKNIKTLHHKTLHHINTKNRLYRLTKKN